MLRLDDGDDCAIDFTACSLVGDGSAAKALRRFVVAREVGRDGRPRPAAIGRAEEHIAAVIHHVRIVLRDDGGGRPVEAIARLVGGLSERELRPGHDGAAELRLHVQLFEDAHIAASVHVARISAIHANVCALAPRAILPVALSDARSIGAGLDDDRRVVLLPAVETVRVCVVHDHMVELRRGLVVLRAPALSAIERNRRPTVVGVDQEARVLRIDPELMVVAVRRLECRERSASVNGFHHRRVHHIDDVSVLRIGRDVHVVPRARLNQPVPAEQPPRLPGIVAAKETALFRFDNGIHALRIRRRYGDADLAHQLWQALTKSCPGVAGVGGLPDAAPRPAASDQPGQTLMIPERRV